MIKLGSKVLDSITGFSGVATGRADYLHETPSIMVESKVDSEGKSVSKWIDEKRLTVVGETEEVKTEAPIKEEKKERKTRTTKVKETPKTEVEEDDESEEVPSQFAETVSDEDDLAGMDEEDSEEQEEKEATVEELRAALMAYAQKHGKAKAYKVLGKYVKKPAGDTPKANEVKQADIAKAIKDLKA